MRRGLNAFLALACVILLCVGCGEKKTQPETPPPEGNQAKDYSGQYTDKQGTDEIYSVLELRQNEDGVYAVTLGIYRTAELIGTAEEIETGKLRFDCYAPDLHVAGEIAIDSDTAEVTVTESDFSYMAAGTVYQFPDGA